jgi:hypothetical protein
MRGFLHSLSSSICWTILGAGIIGLTCSALYGVIVAWQEGYKISIVAGIIALFSGSAMVAAITEKRGGNANTQERDA